MTVVNRLDGFQSIIESAKAQVSGSANTQLVEELSQVGAFLKDMADLATALEMQENITQSNPDILTLTTLLTGNIARVLKPALEAQTATVAPAAVNPTLQAQFDANLAAQTSEDALTADIQRQIAEQQAQAVQPQPPVWTPPTNPFPMPAGLPTEADVQAQAQAQQAQEYRAAQPAPTGVPTQAEIQYRPAPQQVVVGSQPASAAPVAGGKDLTADFRAQLSAQAQPAPQPAITETVQPVQAEDPLTASIRAQVGQQTPAPTAPVAPVAPTPAQSAMQQLFDAKLNEVRSGQ